jgi:hypothetical protein
MLYWSGLPVRIDRGIPDDSDISADKSRQARLAVPALVGNRPKWSQEPRSCGIPDDSDISADKSRQARLAVPALVGNHFFVRRAPGRFRSQPSQAA